MSYCLPCHGRPEEYKKEVATTTPKINSDNVLKKKIIEPDFELKDNPDIKREEILDLFDKINFTDPAKQPYFDLTQRNKKGEFILSNDGLQTSKEELRKGLETLNKRIEEEAGYIGVPTDPIKRKEYYDKLSKAQKTFIGLAKKSEDKARTQREVFAYAVDSLHCGGRWTKGAVAGIKTETGGWDQEIASQGVEGVTDSWIAGLKTGTLEDVTRFHRTILEPHFFNFVGTVMLGEGVTFPDSVDIDVNDSPPWDQGYSDLIKEQFMANFTPDKLTEFIHGQIQDQLHIQPTFMDNVIGVLRSYGEKQEQLADKMKDFDQTLDKKKLEYGTQEAADQLTKAKIFQAITSESDLMTIQQTVKELYNPSPSPEEKALYDLILENYDGILVNNKEALKKLDRFKNLSTEKEEELDIAIRFNDQETIDELKKSGEIENFAETADRLKIFYDSQPKIMSFMKNYYDTVKVVNRGTSLLKNYDTDMKTLNDNLEEGKKRSENQLKIYDGIKSSPKLEPTLATVKGLCNLSSDVENKLYDFILQNYYDIIDSGKEQDLYNAILYKDPERIGKLANSLGFDQITYDSFENFQTSYKKILDFMKDFALVVKLEAEKIDVIQAIKGTIKEAESQIDNLKDDRQKFLDTPKNMTFVVDNYATWLQEPEKYASNLKELGTDRATVELREEKNKIIDEFLIKEKLMVFNEIPDELTLEERKTFVVAEPTLAGTTAFLAELDYLEKPEKPAVVAAKLFKKMPNLEGNIKKLNISVEDLVSHYKTEDNLAVLNDTTIIEAILADTITLEEAFEAYQQTQSLRKEEGMPEFMAANKLTFVDLANLSQEKQFAITMNAVRQQILDGKLPLDQFKSLDDELLDLLRTDPTVLEWVKSKGLTLDKLSLLTPELIKDLKGDRCFKLLSRLGKVNFSQLVDLYSQMYLMDSGSQGRFEGALNIFIAGNKLSVDDALKLTEQQKMALSTPEFIIELNKAINKHMSALQLNSDQEVLDAFKSIGPSLPPLPF